MPSMPSRILLVPAASYASTPASYEEMMLAHAYQQQQFGYGPYVYDNEWNQYPPRYGYNATGYYCSSSNCDTTTNSLRTASHPYSRSVSNPARSACSYSRKRKKPFTIEAILELDSGENVSDNNQRNNDNRVNQDPLVQQRLTPEPVYVSSSSSPPSRNFDEVVAPHYEAVSPPPPSDTTCSSTELSNVRLPSLSPELHSPSNSCDSPEKEVGSHRRAKRIRTIFTPNQLERLESEFERANYLVGPARLELAAELRLTDSQVKIWFQNRRIKQRKQFREVQQAKIAKIKDDTPEENRTEENNPSELYSSCTSGDEFSNEQQNLSCREI